MVVVALVAVGLLVLWRHFNAYEGTSPVLRYRTGEPQTSSQAGDAPRQPSVDAKGLPVLDQEPPVIGSDGLPCDQQDPSHHSMPNGSRIRPDVGTNGYGVLEVQNGTGEDAVLSLYDSAADETAREVYVQAGHSVLMKEIPKGTYELAYARGLDWDNHETVFRCGDPDYAQFEQEFTFTEERDQEGIQYKTITVTLHPVVGGNIRTRRISRQEFLKSNHRTAHHEGPPSGR